MKRSTRHTVILIATLAVCLCAAVPAATAQDEPVLLRAKYVDGAVQALEVSVRQSGPLEIPGQPQPIPQEVEVDVTGLAYTRDVADDQATVDSYTLDMRMKIVVAGQSQVDTDAGADLDLGAIDPRGRCDTTRSDTRNRVLEHISAQGQSGPVEQMQAEMMALLVSPELPEHAIQVGDSWVTEKTFGVGDGEGSARVEWTLEAIEDVAGVRVARLRGATTSRVTDIASPTKSGDFETPQGRMHLLIDEYIHLLTQDSDTVLLWDIEGGQMRSLTATGTLTAESSQTVKSENGETLQTIEGIRATRTGTTTMTYREPTNEELAMMAVLALTNTINRKDRVLLETVLAEGTDTAQTDDELGTLSDAYVALDARAKDPRFTLGDTEGSVAFNLVVKGSRREDRVGADVSEMTEVVNSQVTLTLKKVDGLWLISAIG